MLIHQGKIISNQDKRVKVMHTADFTVYYIGFVFVFGRKAGEDSIRAILDNYQQLGNWNYKEIFGNYFLCILDKHNNKQFAFTDNSRVFRAYIYKDYISTSFLELIEQLDDITLDSIDCNSVTEFLHLEFTCFNKTLIQGLSKIDCDDVYVFEFKQLIKQSKNLDNLGSETSIDLDVFFEHLNHAVTDLNVSIDLTGGIDSRLILSYFNKYNTDFETAISGKPGHIDIKIGEKVAKKVTKPHYPYYHVAENLSNKELLNIFEITDGQVDVLGYHRNYRYNLNRSKRNIEIQISGVGGEIMKDTLWVQDFPFYKKKHTNLSKFYDIRLGSKNFPEHILGEKLKQYSKNLKTYTITNLQSFVKETNTQSYDNINYNYKESNACSFYGSSANHFFEFYAPFLELEISKLGYNLKRYERFYNNYHRKIISKNNASISLIRTTEDTTVSSNLIVKLFDVFWWIYNKFKIVTRAILRKLFKKEYLTYSAADNTLYSYWRENELFSKNLKRLQDLGLLQSELKSSDIPDNLIGKIFTLSFLFDKLDK